MTTSTVPTTHPRVPLRLVMADSPGLATLHGGWWPQSRDLAVELADLAGHFPPELGHIARVVYSPPDWDVSARRVPVGAGYVKVGAFPRDDTHLLIIRTTDRTTIKLLVIPPGYSAGQGAEALLAASTPGNRRSASDLLAEVTDSLDADPVQLWS